MAAHRYRPRDRLHGADGRPHGEGGPSRLDGKPFGWEPREGHLTVFDREEILVGLARGDTLTAIARALGRAVSTVSRRGGARRRTGGVLGVAGARGRTRAGPPTEAVQARQWTAAPEVVTTQLRQLWSPQEIAARLRLEHPDNPEMHVSHETIYQSLFVQRRALRRELARCLRSGRAARKSRTATDGRGRLPGMVMISEHPAEIEDRAVPGHWEGDLILGENSRSAVGTLVERSTGSALLLHLPDGKSADKVEAAMSEAAITALPSSLAPTITWDQGAEMAKHAEFTTATGIPIYFCDPALPVAARQQREHQRAVKMNPESWTRNQNPTGLAGRVGGIHWGLGRESICWIRAEFHQVKYSESPA